MEIVLIDLFKVPEESKGMFLEISQQAQKFVKDLPGFVEGYSYEILDGEGLYSVLTTVVWQTQEHFENAKTIISDAYQKQNFNPPKMLNDLGIEMIRSSYSRSPF